MPKNLSIPKNLRTLKTNFEEADGLGIKPIKKIGFITLKPNYSKKQHSLSSFLLT